MTDLMADSMADLMINSMTEPMIDYTTDPTMTGTITDSMTIPKLWYRGSFALLYILGGEQNLLNMCKV